MTSIEKMCKNLVSVDDYVRMLVRKGENITGTTIRTRIDKVVKGEMTAEKAGFRQHVIGGKYFLEPLG